MYLEYLNIMIKALNESERVRNGKDWDLVGAPRGAPPLSTILKELEAAGMIFVNRAPDESFISAKTSEYGQAVLRALTSKGMVDTLLLSRMKDLKDTLSAANIGELALRISEDE